MPPNDYFKRLVSLDSRYGITRLSGFFNFYSISVNAVITFLKTWSDLLISAASFACYPVVPVKLCFSEPARSTNYNFETVIRLGSFGSYDSIVKLKIQCDLELTSFKLWDAIALLRMPNLYKSSTSYDELASKMYKFSTTN